MVEQISKIKGHAAVLGANIIFGLNVPITKSLLDNWMTPLSYMVTRTIWAAVVFWIIQCFLPKEHVPLKDKGIIALGGILGFIVSQYLTALSLQYTSPVYFSLIVALSPVSVMLLAAVLLKEPITGKKTIGVAVGVLGALILVVKAKSNTGSNNLLGIGLAVTTIVAYSVYLIIMRSVAQKYSAVTQMKWMFLFTAAILIPIGVPDILQYGLFTHNWNWTAISELGFVVIFATSVGYFLMPLGMKRIRATTVSVYMNLQPVVASITAIAIGQDTFSWFMPLAGILVLSGAYIVSTSKARINN